MQMFPDVKLGLNHSHTYRLMRIASFFFRLAEEYGLELIYNKKFHQVYEEASQELDFNQLLYRMNVISEGGSLSADEWEAASMSIFLHLQWTVFKMTLTISNHLLTPGLSSLSHHSRRVFSVCVQEEIAVLYIYRTPEKTLNSSFLYIYFTEALGGMDTNGVMG